MSEIYTRIHIQSFIRKYMTVMPEDLFVELSKLSFQGTHARLTTSTIIELDRRLLNRKEEDKLLAKCARQNNKGTTYEKEGMIDKAIKVYENNISGDCYPACYSFDRLMILYRKQKRYDDEIRVIEKAIEILSPRYPDLKPKYEQRLQKVNILRNNNNIDN